MLRGPCTNMDYNHLKFLFCKIFKRLVVDVMFIVNIADFVLHCGTRLATRASTIGDETRIHPQ